MDHSDLFSELYYFVLIIFAVLVTPLCFGNFQNTRHLQVVIVVVRFLAYLLMLVVPMIFVFQGDPGITVSGDSKVLLASSNGNSSSIFSDLPTEFYVDPSGISSVYGNAIFSFMLHHSIPGLLSPVRPERGAKVVLFIGFFACAIMYVALCTVANLAFYEVTKHG